MEEKFGEHLYKMRSQRTSATNFSKSVNISIVYLRDIERGHRSAPNNQIILKMADTLEMSTEERQYLFDLAAEEKDDIPADIWFYLYRNEDAIRRIREQQKNTTNSIAEKMNPMEGSKE